MADGLYRAARTVPTVPGPSGPNRQFSAYTPIRHIVTEYRIKMKSGGSDDTPASGVIR